MDLQPVISNTVDLHPIVTSDHTVNEAALRFAEAKEAAAKMYAQRDAAEAKQKQERKEALDRGEVYAPALEFIPAAEVKSHLDRQFSSKVGALEEAIRHRAGPLIALLEARERELLSKVSGAKTGDLKPIVVEIRQLKATKAELLRLHRKRVLSGGPKYSEVPDAPVTTGSVVDAALGHAGGTLIGQTDPAAQVPA